MTITDRDREAGDTLIRTWLRDRDPKGLTQRVIEAIAQAREEEREACAKACEAFDASGAPGADISTWGEGVADGAEYAKAGCAAAIRARGED